MKDLSEKEKKEWLKRNTFMCKRLGIGKTLLTHKACEFNQSLPILKKGNKINEKDAQRIRTLGATHGYMPLGCIDCSKRKMNLKSKKSI